MSDHFRFGLLFDSSAPGPGAVVVCADAKQARLQETKRDDEVKSKSAKPHAALLRGRTCPTAAGARRNNAIMRHVPLEAAGTRMVVRSKTPDSDLRLLVCTGLGTAKRAVPAPLDPPRPTPPRPPPPRPELVRGRYMDDRMAK